MQRAFRSFVVPVDADLLLRSGALRSDDSYTLYIVLPSAASFLYVAGVSNHNRK